jgi:glutamate racemase
MTASPKTTSPKIGVIHTSPATVELFGRLLRERIPGATVINLLDDSILPELRDNGNDLSAVEPRWRDYARIVSARGVDIVLNACSTIGAMGDRVQADIPQPIVRVDAAMAAEAVRRGDRIGVLATLATTLGPTSSLIRETAEAAGRTVAVDAELVEGAYPALMAGDQAGHDDLVLAALARSAAANDVVVLAQASMARAATRLDGSAAAKILSSPAFAVEDVAQRLSQPG